MGAVLPDARSSRPNRVIDLAGQVFGNLTVSSFAGIGKNGQAIWACVCSCGRETTVPGYTLRQGGKTRCGDKAAHAAEYLLIYKQRTMNLAGQSFGLLTAVELVEWGARKTRWKCECQCGGSRVVLARSLRAGFVTHCGCTRRKRKKFIPRMSDGCSSEAADARAWVVYALRCPNTFRVRYVGWTVNMTHRMAVHRYRARKCRTTHCERWVASLLSQGKEPQVSILEEGSGSWVACEQKWIKHFRDSGEPLTNITEGGEGYVGYKPTDEAKAKIRQANLGRTHTAESREKRRQAMKGRVFTPEWKEKIRQAKLKNNPSRGKSPPNKGVPMPQEMKDRISQTKKGKPWSESRRRARTASMAQTTTEPRSVE